MNSIDGREPYRTAAGYAAAAAAAAAGLYLFFVPSSGNGGGGGGEAAQYLRSEVPSCRPDQVRMWGCRLQRFIWKHAHRAVAQLLVSVAVPTN